jgi:hydrogenase expression/formation protein HypC
MCLAIPGEVLAIDRVDGLLEADVRFGGVRRRICVECTPDVRPGDYVLAHAGFAIQTIDEEEALRTLEELRRLGESDEAP